MFLSFNDSLEEIKEPWRLAAGSKTELFYHSTKGTCDVKTGVFKTWVKVTAKQAGEQITKSMRLFEF